MRSSLAAVAVTVVVAACSKTEPSAGVDAGVAAAVPDAGVVPRSGTGTGTGVNQNENERPAAKLASADEVCSTAEARGGKSIGHTSTVFKLELADGKKVAWKPNAKKVRGRYKGEIAAYRLATALGIPNVLPACPRVFEVEKIKGALAANADAARALADEAIVEDGKIFGATIAWHDGLTFWPLEKDPLRSEARGWLSVDGAIPKAKEDFARQVSSLVAFDFVTGNWDRYSGENVGLDKAGERVLYIDNDAGFMDPLPKNAAARSETLLRSVDRFSRSFIAGLRTLDDARLAQTFGEEAPGRPLLAPAIVAVVAKRLKTVVGIIDKKIADHGEAATLYFP